MLKVLIVDDEAPIRKWLEYCVEKIDGFTVCGTAANGLQGIETFQATHPNIVITDIEMPGMSGIEMLKQIRQIQPTYAIILTSHDSFTYVREAFSQGTEEYILKTEIGFESLSKLLSKAAKAIDMRSGGDSTDTEQQVQLAVRKMLLTKSQIGLTRDSLRQQGIVLDNDCFLVADIWSKNGQSLQKVRQLVKEQQGLYHLRFVPYNYDHLLVITNLRTELIMQELVERCMDGVKTLSAAIGFSGPAANINNLPLLLKKAHARCNLQFYEPRRKIFWHDSVESEAPHKMENWRISFSKELYAQHFTDALAVKSQVLDTIRTEKPSDIPAVKNLCCFLTTTLLYFTMDPAESLESTVQQVEQDIQNSTSIDELIATVNRVFRPLEKGTSKADGYSKAIQEAVSYIQAHYAEKITLAEVANRVSFNPEYFSRLFSKETGMNFIAYLNHIRMKAAAELLEHTNKKVYEIAEQVGYTSISYFSTAFKKHYGQTPNEYQSQLFSTKNNP